MTWKLVAMYDYFLSPPTKVLWSDPKLQNISCVCVCVSVS